MMADHPFRDLPAVNDVLDTPAVQALTGHHARERIVEAIRGQLAEMRWLLKAGGDAAGRPDLADIPSRVVTRLLRAAEPRLRTVINATGIVLHTNLGRAPV